MNGAVEITNLSLFLGFLLLTVPLALGYYLKIDIIRSSLISTVRMTVQLLFIGVFLRYIFEINSAFLTLGWLLVMIIFATFSVIRGSDMKFASLFIPAFISIALSAVSILLYFNTVIVGLDNIFEAKYLIALGGMVLGNTLRGNIVCLSSFYSNIRKEENSYTYRLAAGATHLEALRPYLKESIKLALSPLIATMATMGIVSLPGMMTGQILGGSNPMTAVKYQIAIMIAIFASASISAILSIIMTLKTGFDEGALLKKSIFK